MTNSFPASRRNQNGLRLASAVQPIERSIPPGLVIYADGCCEPNPGAGGWGYAVYLDEQEVASACGGSHESTNQRMELTAVLEALAWVTNNQPKRLPRLFSDSAYTVNGCNDWRHKWRMMGWRRGGPNAKAENSNIANLDLWQMLDGALTQHPVTLEWCKGHAGIIGNERADELALIGRDMVLVNQPAPTPSQLDMIRQQLAPRA
ncbi:MULTISPECIES: ribonuclease H [unclassified Mesorhizobium]|nr:MULTISPECIES: ribonuclease H [unclassified Mesorhizobium]AZO63032.1 ribonuclease HI [Mesorhizobium sp. M1A.F.Ca.IN.022.06.1.1]MCT2578586.1 ribonuclease HI [Mesorhizobium sp. P13.3]MDF3167399.1 ribonuclease HI [Mesorhizobium sp. P16.1]MDF3179071.1 ribonuclease HI [Mesorhizobium sp. P17.1]MDF3184311.1 ribonuclease HI [Mesorhizobium sp. ICCV3110.1]